MTQIDEPNLDKQIEVIVSIACGAELGLLDDEYVDEDIKRMNAAIRANKDRLRKPIKALIANQVREARIDGIREYADALIDLFVNPPAELGAAEDIHLHPWQIKNMILETLNHLDELKGDDK